MTTTNPTHELSRPDDSEYDDFYRGYIEELPDSDILEILEAQNERFETLPVVIEPSREQFRYDEGKWSIREVIGHLSDAERVFGYRALCVSRGDETALPGFDENDYVASSGSDARSLRSLTDELMALREANILLFRDLPSGSAGNLGNANGSPVSVRALAWIIAGHAEHHLRVLRERYGIEN